jgi:probable HAF family extracellular repeat protein
MNARFTALAIAAFIATGTLPMAAQAAKWKVTDLGTVGKQSFLFLNNAGQVAGTDSSEPQGGGPYTAFVTGPNGTNRHNNYVGSSLESIAHGINDSGVVLSAIGSGTNWTLQSSNATSTTPVFHNIAHQMYGYEYSTINNKGQIAATNHDVTTGQSTNILANADGSTITPLSVTGYTMDITETGQILLAGTFNSVAISGPNGVGSTTVQFPAGLSSFYGRRLNDAGQVIGELRYSDNVPHAFITGPNGVGVTDLGTLGSRNSDAMGINNAGQVVGAYGDNANLWHAFITEPGGKNPRDLANEVTLPVGYLTTAYAINDKGQVAAADYYNGRAYLLTPDSACSVTYKVTSSSKGKFNAQVTVSNLTSAALKGWTVKWDYNNNTLLTNVKNAKLPLIGQTDVTATPVATNTTINAGGSTVFTFTGNTGGSTLPTVTNLQGTLGGQSCAASLL